MLKRYLSFCLVTVVIIGSSTSSIFALSTPVVSGLQTQGKSTSGVAVASEEFVSIYNNSTSSIDVSNWCAYRVSSSGVTQTKLVCFVPPNNHTKLKLGGHQTITLSSAEFAAAHPGFTPDFLFTAGISATSGYIKLLDSGSIEIDQIVYGVVSDTQVSHGPPPAIGMILQRVFDSSSASFQDTGNNSTDLLEVIFGDLPVVGGIVEEDIPIDICGNITGLQTELPIGYLKDEIGDCQQDVCANIDGLQLLVPNDYESIDGENCTKIPLENTPILITELLPNVTSYDTGSEFIEVYNPNNRQVSLNGYVLQLGPGYSKAYSFPIGTILEPLSYKSFSDTLTGLVLPNSSASTRLIAPAGNVVSETNPYLSPADNMAWALIDDIWQYTNRPTPGLANLATVINQNEENDVQTASILSPCSVGKYRNPDTNRCRNIEAGDIEVKACEPGQTRNPDTNRCRGASSTSGNLPSCKEGQERNPETNRCRTIITAVSALKPCDVGEERNPDTNRCRKSSTGAVSGIATVKDVKTNSIKSSPRWLLASIAVFGALGYGLYEWRKEIVGILSGFKSKLVFRPGK